MQKLNRSKKLGFFILLCSTLLLSLFSARSFPRALASADVTIATLAGTFQSELGCTGDWDPACPNTNLTDVGNGVFRAVYAIPEGAHAYKVATEGSWSSPNYPANDIALAVSGTQTVTFYYDSKTNGVMDTINQPKIPVATGELQSEVGCAGDWDPACVQTLLTDADGDGVYTFQTTALLAGTYNLKVAFNEGWGNGELPASDYPCVVASDNQLTTFSWNSADDTVSCAGPAATTDATLTAPPVAYDVQNDAFYFILTDRFENGDTTNDEGAMAGGSLAETGLKKNDKSFYHGGDLQGLINRLDYVSNLGITGIWITPIFKNQATQSDGSTAEGIGGAYHGYWILDYENTDPHLGTNAELKAFIDAAHARGIKVFFDIVVNHTADVISFAENEYAYRSKEDYPYKDATGTAFDDHDYADGDPAFPTLSETVSFPYTPVVNANSKNPAWLNNPLYYHNRGNSTFVGENSQYGDFFGLDDVFTEHPDVVAGFTQIYKDWIANYGVDGYRIDTVKHVNDELWQQFTPEIISYANSLGKEFYMFGEVFSADPSILSHYTTNAKIPSVLDFSLQSSIRSYVAANGKSNTLWNSTFSLDDLYTDADSNAYGLANFISNHDGGLERLGHYIRSSNPTETDAELTDRLVLGHSLIFFSRGFPIVYYGDEQGFTGGGSDKLAREDMMPSLVPEYNANDLIGTTATTADSNFDPTHPVYQKIAEFSALRQAHLALRSGAQIQRYAEDQAGIYAFSRIERNERIEYIVAFNNSKSEDTATFATYSPNTTFSSIYGTQPSASADATGQLTITVPALGSVIYRADTAAPCGTETPIVTINVSADLLNRTEIGATLSNEANYAEVTFAMSNDGGANYTIIGTDTNAPYRVFYDVSGYAPGTELTFQAVADDLCPNTANTVSSGSGTVVAPEPPADANLPRYAIIHYNRTNGDYGDPTSADATTYWGIHAWGAPFDATKNMPGGNAIAWDNPVRMWGEDDFGRFAYIQLDQTASTTEQMGLIIHKGNDKNTPNDLFVNPFSTPEIWVTEGDETLYTSEAEAQGYVTFHYNRPDGNYTGWGLHLWQDNWGTDWGAPLTSTMTDTYGAVYTLNVADYPNVDFSKPINFIMHNGDTKDPIDSPDRAGVFSGADDALWLKSESVDVYTQVGAATGKAYIHYHREDGDYGDYASADYNDFWGLHVWQDTTDAPQWTAPLKPIGFDQFGAIFEVNLTDGANQIGYLIHRGDTKDPGVDQALEFAKSGYEVWQVTGADPLFPYVYPIAVSAPQPSINLTKPTAFWVNENTILWPLAEDSSLTYALHYDNANPLAEDANGVTGNSIPLTLAGTYDASADGNRFPHLNGLPMLTIDSADLALLPEILKSHFAIVGSNDSGPFVGATAQIPGVLDSLYTPNAYDEPLGVVWNGITPTLRVWAPTAQSVTLHVFDDSNMATTSTTYPMVWDAASGIWTYEGMPDWKNKYYLYEVKVWVNSVGAFVNNVVTDPYSISLSTNSKRSQIVDLEDPALKPAGWDTLSKPTPANNDISIYELHIRDFSIEDATVRPEYRGGYMAFTENSNGMAHIRNLTAAGLGYVHLLPAFDIATVEEDKSLRVEPDTSGFGALAPDSDQQQAAVMAVSGQDGFNWGYDPFHYTAPEGSYSTNPDGTTRIQEFRSMVQALNAAGARVVMDVVYNHTSDAGQADKSVLDKVVPGYYHRLDGDGVIYDSTCCKNTASEHLMFEKLMIDSLKTWATAYKIDGFRFDLMGHHMKSNMLNVRAALDGLNVATDGVDGANIYVYGEGWNFGEVADNALGVNATQLNMAGTGIGTFSDRLRDAVRGPGPFDSGVDLTKQGFMNGLFFDPNTHIDSNNRDRLMLLSDQIRIGLAGNLANYQFVDRNGNLVMGKDVDYNGQPAGYALDPKDNVIYISKHDNQTAYDINAYTLPAGTSMADRVRVQNLGLSLVALGQGVPFFHAGSDILRSKSLDRNSYNSGDWFNSLDWTYQTNNFGIGLPPEADNGANWDVMRPLLADPALVPTQADIVLNNAVFREFLQIRGSSPLFHLSSADEIQQRLAFHNTGTTQQEGLIVMDLMDNISGTTNLAPDQERIIVLFNANDQAQTFVQPTLINQALELHDVQKNSADATVRTSTFDETTGTFSIPARTTAVFVVAERPTNVKLAETTLSNTGQMNTVMIVTALSAVMIGTIFVYLRRRHRA